MIYGYARVSTADQELGRQIEALKKAGCDEIIEEKVSGSGKKKRPALDGLIKILQPGDRVIVQKLDRLGRSLQDLIRCIELFDRVGVGFVSLTESMDMTTSHGKLVFQIMGAIAEFERNLIVDRTRDGVRYKKSIGVQLGRKGDVSLLHAFRSLMAEGKSRVDVQKELLISKHRYYYLKRLI